MVLFMKDNFFNYVKDFIDESTLIYIGDIRENNPNAFTRNRKINIQNLMLQMFLMFQL